jgi:hypothetical protein
MTNLVNYHPDTPHAVKQTLEMAQRNGERIRIYCGDTETGIPWNEEHDVCGYVGRSTGTKPILLLVHNRRSLGGGAILTHCIVRIATSRGKRTLYQADNYQPPIVTVEANTDQDYPQYSHCVFINGELYARCESESYASRLAAHMR